MAAAEDAGTGWSGIALASASTNTGAGPEAAGKGFSCVGLALTMAGAGLPAAGKGFSGVGRDGTTGDGRGGAATVVGGVTAARGWA